MNYLGNIKSHFSRTATTHLQSSHAYSCLSMRLFVLHSLARIVACLQR